jgi:hypothetical protein
MGVRGRSADPLSESSCLRPGDGIDDAFIRAFRTELHPDVKLIEKSLVAVSVAPDKSATSQILRRMRVWYLAGELLGRGVGLWVTSESPNESPMGLIIGVNNVARTGSDWGSALRGRIVPDADSAGAVRALECSALASRGS